MIKNVQVYNTQRITIYQSYMHHVIVITHIDEQYENTNNIIILIYIFNIFNNTLNIIVTTYYYIYKTDK